jgi:putative redox protein
MKIFIERINDKVHLKATNEGGNSIYMDGSESIGGQNLGMRPMQLLLAALGGCSSMDVLSILAKQKQSVDKYEVLVEGERETGKEPSLFKDIHVHFKVSGNVEEEKLKRAIELSMSKYCSVAKTLEHTAKITYSYELV